MAQVDTSIDIDLPVQTVYNQWTQFEEFPRFMEGVEQVRQIDDQTLHWVAEIGGVRREWDAQITEQEPDRRIAWMSIGGALNAGVVTFHPLGDGEATRVSLMLEFDPETFVEKVGDALGFVKRRAEGDLERFKAFVEARGAETGAWRGEIHQEPGTMTPPADETFRVREGEPAPQGEPETTARPMGPGPIPPGV